METKIYYIQEETTNEEIMSFMQMLVEANLCFTYNADDATLEVANYRQSVFDNIDTWLHDSGSSIRVTE